MTQHYLKVLFAPKSVAVFGASDRLDSVGGVVYENLRTGGFAGPVFAINPKRETVQGQKAYASLEDVGQSVDLAVICTPAATVPDIIETCGKMGVRGAVILTAGFSEAGAEGLALEKRLLDIAAHYGLRFIGPNCLGTMRPSIGFNATFNRGIAKPGNLALVSQSGALCTAILDWAQGNSIGFSSVISLGASADVDFGEILDFLVHDPQTESILLYIEGIRQSRSFMSALRAAARVKPVIAVKVGRHASGMKAAQSHTGALVGGDDAFDAALKRAGVVRVQSVTQLFAVALALTSRYRRCGNRLAIVTNAGGPGVIATDRAADLGLALAELSTETIANLNKVLPPTWSHHNPVDIIGDANAERYEMAIDACLKDDGVDGILVILTPQAMTNPTAVAEKVIALANSSPKPVLACWMGEMQVREARQLFTGARIPNYRTPELAVETFSFIAAFYHNQQLLMQSPGPLSHHEEPDVEGARMLIESVLAERRTVLSEMESKALLSAFRIPVAQTMVAHSPNEALLIAQQLGFPVAMKINSPDITHKTDAGGVRLNVATAGQLRAAYHDIIEQVQKKAPNARIDGISIESMVVKPNGRELMVGIVSDPVFGPVITFGAGGTAVEVLADRAVALPPLNQHLVGNLINGTRVSRLLKAFRNMPPADIGALESLLLRVSEMVCELPWIREMDINPLIVDERGALAADARVIVGFCPATADRYSHMAIYPYPTHLVSLWQLADGTDIIIRPVRSEDAEVMQAFVRAMSDESRYFRFMDTMRELNQSMLSRFTQIDYDREMALIATTEEGGQELMLGVARYIINPDGESCEFATAVADAWQGRGIGQKLMRMLMEVARDKGLRVMESEVLARNAGMLELAEALGFEILPLEGDEGVRGVRKKL
ncbi:acetyltransferase [Novimethylophilus kurashikiensis]|uniref:Acetyltransferase n=1 Tax=Novimethylophilus kurashikiensis TaxID=1825523 RepID=A0A2R5F270_9PROT|nr:bifunctional acetate--CoA ligase family protein/GNAT family N-acetyltransferase [Novimethylophilus kurashikiensis]GBG12722.1 acetyltransferase [Novimethylophilus kurashikiensis]